MKKIVNDNINYNAPQNNVHQEKCLNESQTHQKYNHYQGQGQEQYYYNENARKKFEIKR